MDTEFIAQEKQRLIALQEELKGDLQQLREFTREGIIDANEIRDQEDLANIDMQQKTNIAEINFLERRLQQIDHALQAIDQGTYGICEHCGNPIAQERLEANPSATLCITCQKAVEASKTNRR